MFDKNLSPSYLSLRNRFDSSINNPSNTDYNFIKNTAFEMKSSNILPNNMYNAINDYQNTYSQKLGGLEDKVNKF